MATYAANIAIDVLGLGKLDSLERRVNVLRENFTKINAAAANISAPFQNHIQALERMNTLLVANGRLLEQQANAADKLSRAAEGATKGGRGKSGPDPRVLQEQTEQLQRQINLLRDRARVFGAENEAMDKLRGAWVELNRGANGNLTLVRQMIRNARELVKIDEDRAKALEATGGLAIKEYEERLRLARELREFEIETARNLREMRAEDRRRDKADSDARGRVASGLGRIDQAWGSPIKNMVGGLTDSALKFGSVMGIEGALQIPGEGMGVRAIGAHMGGVFEPIANGIASVISAAHHMGPELAVAIAGCLAFSDQLGAMFDTVLKGVPVFGKLGKSILDVTGVTERAKPILSSLSRSVEAMNDNALTNFLYGLGPNSMTLPSTAGAFTERSGANSFGPNLNKELIAALNKELAQFVKESEEATRAWQAFEAAGKSEHARELAQAAEEFAKFKLDSIAETANVQSRIRLRKAETKELYAQANLVKETYGYNGKAPALMPAGFTSNDVGIKNRLDDQAAAAKINADLEMELAKIVNTREMELVQELLNKEITATEQFLAARTAADEKWWAEHAARFEANIKREEEQQAAADQRKKDRSSRLESIALGVGFPLLFGGGTGSVLGSLAGSFVGSGFGGQILGGAIGTAIDELVTKTIAFNKSLAELNAGLPQSGAALRTTAKDVDFLAERLGLAREDALKLVDTFSIFDSAKARKELAAAFGKVGGIETVNALAGMTDEKKAVEEIAKLHKQIGNAATEEALTQLRTNGAKAAQLVIEQKLLEIAFRKSQIEASQPTLKDFGMAIVDNLLAARTGGEPVTYKTYGEKRVAQLKQANAAQVLELLKPLQDLTKNLENARSEFSDKTTNAAKKSAEQVAAEQARINEQLMRDQIEIDNAVWNHRRQLLEEERALRRQIAEAEGRIYGLQQTGGGKSGADIVNQIMSVQRDYQESVLKLKSNQADAMNGLIQAQRGVAATAAGPAPTGSRFKPTQYLTGDPNSPNYRADHGGTAKYHDHLAFGTHAEAMAAARALMAAGINVTELQGLGAGVTGPHSGPNSAHMSGLAFDVPGYQWGGSGAIGSREYAGSAKIRSILGMGNSKVVKSQGQVGVAAAGVDAANKGLKEQIPLLEELRRLKEDEVISGITSSYKEQAKAITDSTASLKLRNRLEMEGVSPEIVDGEVKKAEIYGKAEEQVRALRESLAALGPKTEKNADVFDRFNQAINATESGSRAAAAAVDANTQALLQQKTPAFELAKKYGDLQVELERLSDPAANIINAAGSISAAFDNTFTAITTGTVTAQQAFAQFTQSLAANFMKMATQMIAKWIEMKIIGLAMNFFPMEPFSAPATTGLGSNFSSAIGNDTGISWGSALGFRAAGGPVSSNSPYIVGEKGPELFVPSSSGRIIPNNSLAGGTTNVVVNVDATGSNVQGDAAQAKQLGAVVSMAVQAELIKQKRPGGILA